MLAEKIANIKNTKQKQNTVCGPTGEWLWVLAVGVRGVAPRSCRAVSPCSCCRPGAHGGLGLPGPGLGGFLWGFGALLG